MKVDAGGMVVAVGLFTLRAGSTMRAMGPADRSSFASISPPRLPSSASAAFTFGRRRSEGRKVEHSTKVILFDGVACAG